MAVGAESDDPPEGPAGLGSGNGPCNAGTCEAASGVSMKEVSSAVCCELARPRGKGQVSDKLISLQDLFATMADFLEIEYGRNSGEDSFSFWPQVIEGPEAPAARDHVIVQSPLGVLRSCVGWLEVHASLAGA